MYDCHLFFFDPFSHESPLLAATTLYSQVSFEHLLSSRMLSSRMISMRKTETKNSRFNSALSVKLLCRHADRSRRTDCKKRKREGGLLSFPECDVTYCKETGSYEFLDLSKTRSLPRARVWQPHSSLNKKGKCVRLGLQSATARRCPRPRPVLQLAHHPTIHLLGSYVLVFAS
jgi:hypothetical protein